MALACNPELVYRINAHRGQHLATRAGLPLEHRKYIHTESYREQKPVITTTLHRLQNCSARGNRAFEHALLESTSKDCSGLRALLESPTPADALRIAARYMPLRACAAPATPPRPAHCHTSYETKLGAEKDSMVQIRAAATRNLAAPPSAG